MNTSAEKHVWETIIVVATTVAAIVIPLKLVLGLQNTAGFLFFEIVLSVLFVGDVIANLTQKEFVGGLPNAPAELLPIFAADIVAAVPFVLLSFSPSWQLLRLLKFGRAFVSAWRYWRGNVHRSLVLRIILFTYLLALATHWLTCGWLALRGIDVQVDSLTNYVSSLYFCVTTLTTVGFGDLTPANNAERLFVIIMELFGVAVYGFAIGNVASMLTRLNPARTHYTENMEKLEAFMNYKSLPMGLRKRLTQYYAYLWEQRLGYDESSILASLPPSLKTEVSLHLKHEIIQKVPLFKDAGDDFIKEIALQITSVVYLPGDYVVVAGEHGDDMFFVSRGELEVVSKDGQKVFSRLNDGDFFGEIALILKKPRSASVRAITYCDLYRLDRDLFERLLLRYHEVAEKIHERARERNERG